MTSRNARAPPRTAYPCCKFRAIRTIVAENMWKTALAYILILLVFGAGIYQVLRTGKQIETDRTKSTTPAATIVAESNPATTPARVVQTLRDNLHEPLSLLLVQLIIIVLLARTFGWLAAKAGQPEVIGEMVAGIVLGPSVAGIFCPDIFQFIFPANSLGALRILSQVGVILFMFLVGMELDLPHARRRARTALAVSNAGIILPCFSGGGFRALHLPDVCARTCFIPWRSPSSWAPP